MENSTPTRRRTTLDLPKTTDTGLTEWATKIKMMQQEVDEDAEDEQRKLQEEIEKSRLERARRRNSTSIDWSMCLLSFDLQGILFIVKISEK